MTVLEDRITMAEESDELTLDVMSEWLEKMPVPEGTKVEIVGGEHLHVTATSHPLADLLRHRPTAERQVPGQAAASDVRIDFPGRLNGFAGDVAAMADRSVPDAKGRWHYRDIEFVAEVVSENTAANDYGPKKLTYALAEVPIYLIADPYEGECRVYTHPMNGDYTTETKLPFGEDLDLTDTPVGLVLRTDEFPRD